MKLIKFIPLIFFAIYFANSLEPPSKLAESACKIVGDVLKKENWMKTIAIVKFENNFNEKVINSLIKCLPMEITVVLINVKNFNMNSVRIHQVAMVVMIVESYEELTNKVIKFLEILIK